MPPGLSSGDSRTCFDLPPQLFQHSSQTKQQDACFWPSPNLWGAQYQLCPLCYLQLGIQWDWNSWWTLWWCVCNHAWCSVHPLRKKLARWIIGSLPLLSHHAAEIIATLLSSVAVFQNYISYCCGYYKNSPVHCKCWLLSMHPPSLLLFPPCGCALALLLLICCCAHAQCNGTESAGAHGSLWTHSLRHIPQAPPLIPSPSSESHSDRVFYWMLQVWCIVVRLWPPQQNEEWGEHLCDKLLVGHLELASGSKKCDHHWSLLWREWWWNLLHALYIILYRRKNRCSL